MTSLQHLRCANFEFMPARRYASPPLVLLPGTLCDERVFAPLLGALREAANPPDAAIVMTAHLDSIEAAAEHVLSVSPPRFACLGFSLGGIVALELALRAPDRVCALALLNVNAGPAPPHTHAARREAVLRARSRGHAGYLRDELWPSYVGPACREDASLRDLLAAMPNDLGHEAFHKQTEAALCRRDYRGLLHGIRMPVLVCGGELDAICPAEAQREMAESIPGARFVPVADAGHFALLERHDIVTASVAAWLHDIPTDTFAQQSFKESQ